MTAMLQVFTDVVAMPEESTSVVVEMQKANEDQVDKYDEVFKRLSDLEAKVGLVQDEKAKVEAELQKSKEELAKVIDKNTEMEKQLDTQETIEETIQKRKVIGRVASAPVPSPKIPIFAMGENGRTLRQI
jgi:DNA anti-recombination protein RmuC